MEDDEEGNEEVEKEEELKEVKEDAVVTSSEFRQWKILAKSNQNVLDLLCEIMALAASDDNDDEFEEVDDDNMIDQQEEIKEQDKVIDIDQIK